MRIVFVNFLFFACKIYKTQSKDQRIYDRYTKPVNFDQYSVIKSFSNLSNLECALMCNNYLDCVLYGTTHSDVTSSKCIILEKRRNQNHRLLHFQNNDNKDFTEFYAYRDIAINVSGNILPNSNSDEFVIVFYGNSTNTPRVVKNETELTNFTISFWFFLESGERTNSLMTLSVFPLIRGLCDHLLLYIDGGNKLQILSRPAVFSTNIFINPRSWNHLAVVWNSLNHTLSVYVNGTILFTGHSTYIQSLPGDYFEVYLGQDVNVDSNQKCIATNPNNALYGTIKDFNIYKSILNMNEITKLSNHADISIETLVNWTDFQKFKTMKNEGYLFGYENL